MKKIFVLSYFILTSLLFAQEKIVVNIHNVKNDKGNLLVAVYDSKANFLKKHYLGKKVKAEKGTVTVEFENVPPGIYAVSLFHDENGNDKLDTNFMGIPKEKYGTSRNAKGFMGPPKFDDAKFELREGKVITLQINL